jgi:hypothetical protein
MVGVAALGFLLHYCLKHPAAEGAGDNATAAPQRRAGLFQLWPHDRKPDLALLLSGEMHGYLQPCGCSEPQYGGLERRYNFMQDLIKQRGWPVVAVDVGDIAQKSGPQALLKYKYSMEALHKLNYAAVGIGLSEMSLPLFEGLAAYSLNNASPPVLSANLADKDANFPGMVKSWDIATKPNSPTVGVIGVVSASVAREVKDPSIKFNPVNNALPVELQGLANKKPAIRVLLFEGTVDEAKACAAKYPQFQVVQCLTSEEEPPDKPEKVKDTLIVQVGHKGRYVGLVGFFATGKANPAFDMHYQLAALGPEHKTPPGNDTANPILGLLEDYAKEVKDKNFLAYYAKTKHAIQLDPAFKDAKYVGSEKCKSCHKEAYKVWKASPHSRAYASLEKAQRPGLRQYDGECVACHVTGFDYNTGFVSEEKTPLLKENGCENCHGPGSLHVTNPNNPQLNALMNPYKTQENETPQQKTKRLNELDKSCQKCHDVDNDVHWKIDKWITGHIVHTKD